MIKKIYRWNTCPRADFWPIPHLAGRCMSVLTRLSNVRYSSLGPNSSALISVLSPFCYPWLYVDRRRNLNVNLSLFVTVFTPCWWRHHVTCWWRHVSRVPLYTARVAYICWDGIYHLSVIRSVRAHFTFCRLQSHPYSWRFQQKYRISKKIPYF